MTVAPFAHSIPAPAVVTIDGRDFRIGPIDLDCLSACAAEMRRLAGDPFEAIMPRIAALPEALAERLFREALDAHNAVARATPMQALVWALDVPDGTAFLLWYLISRGSPHDPPSREQIMRHCVELRIGQPDQYAALIEQLGDASGYKSLSKAAAAVHRAAAKLMSAAITGRSPGDD